MEMVSQTILCVSMRLRETDEDEKREREISIISIWVHIIEHFVLRVKR